MNTFVSFLKVLLACSLIWFGIYLLTMGLLTTMIVLSVFLLIFSLASLFSGIWLGLHLLKRKTDVALRITLIVLVPLGVAVVLGTINNMNWFKGF